MKNNELKKQMDVLYEELLKSDNEKTDRLILAKAVNLGMEYRKQQIKDGINIVFNEL